MKKLANIPSRLIYLIMFAAVTIPMIVPLGLPLRTGATVTKSWQLIDSLQPGDVVHLTFEFEAVGIPELGPMLDVILPTLAKKQVKVVGISFTQQGVIYGNMYMKKLLEPVGYVYGEDYINLGYIPGRTASAVAYAEDIWSTVGKDFYGKSLENYPIMQNIRSISDYALVIHAASDPADGVGSVEFITNVAVPNKVTMLLCIHTLAVALNMPYLQAGQLQGIIPGLRGAAELEKIANMKGLGLASMDAQSLAHVVIIGLIVIGNVAYIQHKKSKKGAA